MSSQIEGDAMKNTAEEFAREQFEHLGADLSLISKRIAYWQSKRLPSAALKAYEQAIEPIRNATQMLTRHISDLHDDQPEKRAQMHARRKFQADESFVVNDKAPGDYKGRTGKIVKYVAPSQYEIKLDDQKDGEPNSTLLSSWLDRVAG
jgi:hypothetical protein